MKFSKESLVVKDEYKRYSNLTFDELIIEEHINIWEAKNLSGYTDIIKIVKYTITAIFTLITIFLTLMSLVHKTDSLRVELVNQKSELSILETELYNNGEPLLVLQSKINGVVEKIKIIETVINEDINFSKDMSRNVLLSFGMFITLLLIVEFIYNIKIKSKLINCDVRISMIGEVINKRFK